MSDLAYSTTEYTLNPTPPGQRQRARTYIAANAHNADDAALLLAALDLCGERAGDMRSSRRDRSNRRSRAKGAT